MEFTVEEAALRGGVTWTIGTTPGAGDPGGGAGGTPGPGGGGGGSPPPGAAWNPNHVMRNLEAGHVPTDDAEEGAMARIVSYMASRGAEGREGLFTLSPAGALMLGASRSVFPVIFLRWMRQYTSAPSCR
jgi:hypothetical protein